MAPPPAIRISIFEQIVRTIPSFSCALDVLGRGSSAGVTISVAVVAAVAVVSVPVPVGCVVGVLDKIVATSVSVDVAPASVADVEASDGGGAVVDVAVVAPRICSEAARLGLVGVIGGGGSLNGPL